MSDPANPSAPTRTGKTPFFLILVALAVITVNLVLLNRSLNQNRQQTIEHRFWTVCQPGFTATQRTDAFLELVRFGNLEWYSAKLHDLDLTGVSLPGVILQRADFSNSRFAKAVLAKADLSNCLLREADLSGANLDQADLSAADLFRSKAAGASFKQARLQSSLCQEADLTDAQLQVADLSEADLLMADLSGANLAGANLTSANLEAAVLKNTNLSLARLSGANLKDGDFADSNWWRARGLSSADLVNLTKDFPPSTNATAELRADFKTWLGKGN
jgi:uncharacterized protein YjbI with pentapeptide repeats